MPFPRPVSPITFETCPSSAHDNDYDDLLGSDDELDDAARAARERRIEKLAESYLRGNQLFILSASLRGPFEDGWKNPWKKERKHGSENESKGHRTNGDDRQTERVVQETDLRHPRYREDLSASRPATTDAALGGTSHTAAGQDANSAVTSLNQKRSIQTANRDEQDRASPRPAKKARVSFSYTTDDQSIATGREVDWLKKDRKRLNFGNFEPPSSPTPKIGIRHAETRLRRSAPRTGGGECSRHASSVGSIRGSAAPRSARSTPRLGPGDLRQSPRGEETSPKPDGHAASSFRMVSSTSQLPRFEYRRWHHSSLHGPSEPPAQETAHDAAPVDAVEDQDGDLPLQDAPEDTGEAIPGNTAAVADQPAYQPKDLRFADDAGPNPTDTSPQATTEQHTCEDLPSAQQAPAFPETSERTQSLHSTALPRTDDEHNTVTSADTQLSTQAALLHAQESFQNDLESPEQVFGRIPGEQLESPAADDSILLANETPYHHLMTAEKAPRRSFRQPTKDRMNALSTQRMLDAATPYTFSTEKKPSAYRTISPQQNGNEEQEKSSRPPNSTTSSGTSSPSPGPEYQTAHSSTEGSSAGEIVQPPDESPAHRSTTQGTALPFNVSASTPTMAQDGQGGLQADESFNLSQAIADAGSWLQQSLDFFNEIRQSSQQA